MSKPQLTLIKITTLDDGAPASATVRFYRQGAATDFSGTIPATTSDHTITVYDVGEIEAGDAVRVGANGGEIEIQSVVSATELLITNNGSAISVSPGTRLIVLDRKPAVYSVRGGQPVSNSELTSDANGRLIAYVEAVRFDYTTRIGSGTYQLFFDAPGGYFKSEPRSEIGRLNALDFANIQDAVDALPSTGGTVFIPAGTYTPSTSPAFTGLLIRPGVELVGEGRLITQLKLVGSGYKDTDCVNVAPAASGIVGGVRIRNIHFEGANVVATTETQGVGLRLYADDETNGWVSGVQVEGCDFMYTGGWGCYVVSEEWFIDQFTFTDVLFASAKSGGSLKLGKEGGPGANVLTFIRCQFNGPSMGTYGEDDLQRGSVHISHSTVVNFIGCSFQEITSGTAVSFHSVSRQIAFRSCHFETNVSSGTQTLTHWFTANPPTGVTGVAVDSCTFMRHAHASSEPSAEVGVMILKVGASSNIVGWMFINCHFFTNKATDDATDDVVLGDSGLDEVFFINCLREGTSGLHAIAVVHGSNASQRIGKLFQDSRLRLPGINSSTRDALTVKEPGDIIYNSQLVKYQMWNGSAWESLS